MVTDLKPCPGLSIPPSARLHGEDTYVELTVEAPAQAMPGEVLLSAVMLETPVS